MANEAGNDVYISAETVPSRARGYIYFIRVGDKIKIGYSTRPTDRLKALQTSNSGKLEILGTMWATRDRERALHQQFAHLHVRGEWFAARSDLLQHIERFTPEGDAAKTARHRAEMPVGPPPARRTKASEAEIRKLRSGLCRLRPGHPESHIISTLSEQLKNYAENPAGLGPLMLQVIQRLETAE